MSFTLALHQYAECLLRWQSIWRLQPFAEAAWPWSQSAAELSAAIAQDLAALPQVMSASQASSQADIPFWLSRGIGGRKLAQIQGFLAQLPPLDGAARVLEWCAGKGHLGRLWASTQGGYVHSVEWQQVLCEQGQQLADKAKLTQQFHCCDVMQWSAQPLPWQFDAALAMHACGDLHRELLQQTVQQAWPLMALAPCCYHRQAADHYQPLATAAQQLGLPISQAELKWIGQAQVTGGQRIGRLRACETHWRLAFQMYRQQLTGDQRYQSLPSVAKHWFSDSPQAFFAWAARQQQLPAPSAEQIPDLLAAAAPRLRLVQAMDQLRQPLQRVLETYLLLDQACYLEQQGYRVQLLHFCEYQQSPRQTLLLAQRIP